jgi:hypothetical protein
LKQQLADLTKNDSEMISFSRSPIANDAVVINELIAKKEPDNGGVHNYSTPSEKLALFRNLFREVVLNPI